MNLEIGKHKKIDGATKIVLDKHPLGLVVKVVDNDGNEIDGGHLVIINNSGIISRCPSVSDELGFQLNDKGRIRLCD